MTQTIRPQFAHEPEPAWQVATLFPPQGCWSESDYLFLTDSSTQLVELSNGHIEILAMPTKMHQWIVRLLSNLLQAYLLPTGRGDVLFAPYRIRTSERSFREPDLVAVLAENADRLGDRFGQCPDLVMEVVSDDAEGHKRDWVDKRREYATAGIAEYWIVDPQQQRIVVLKLQGDQYIEHAAATATGTVESALLPGFTVDAENVWKAGRGELR